VWELYIQKRLRKPLVSEISKLKSEFKKLDFTTELSKKDIGDLYKKFQMTEKEIESIKKGEKGGLEVGKDSQPQQPKLAINDQHLFVLKLLGSSEEKRALANFVLAYYLNIFNEKDRSHYKTILSELLDYELIDFLSIKGKTFVEITEKGFEYLKTIEKMM
jgi:hypothetical protein